MLWAIFILLFLMACNDGTISATGPMAPNMETMYQTKASWEGRYLASLPCNDCEGLVTMLQINEDLSYTKRYSYVGKSSEILEFKGSFDWTKEGEILRIGDPVLGERPEYYKIIPDGLLLLDNNLNEQTGENASRYKFNTLAINIHHKYWELTEMMGVNINGSLSNIEPSIQFSDSTQKVNGFGNCNSFFGQFELGNIHEIKISKIGSTRKSCPQLDQEQAYLQLLESTRFFSLGMDTLQLGKDSGIADLIFVYNPFKNSGGNFKISQ